MMNIKQNREYKKDCCRIVKHRTPLPDIRIFLQENVVYSVDILAQGKPRVLRVLPLLLPRYLCSTHLR